MKSNALNLKNFDSQLLDKLDTQLQSLVSNNKVDRKVAEDIYIIASYLKATIAKLESIEVGSSSKDEK